jgi:hypothetical protein
MRFDPHQRQIARSMTFKSNNVKVKCFMSVEKQRANMLQVFASATTENGVVSAVLSR